MLFKIVSSTKKISVPSKQKSSFNLMLLMVSFSQRNILALLILFKTAIVDANQQKPKSLTSVYLPGEEESSKYSKSKEGSKFDRELGQVVHTTPETERLIHCPTEIIRKNRVYYPFSQDNMDACYWALFEQKGILKEGDQCSVVLDVDKPFNQYGFPLCGLFSSLLQSKQVSLLSKENQWYLRIPFYKPNFKYDEVNYMPQDLKLDFGDLKERVDTLKKKTPHKDRQELLRNVLGERIGKFYLELVDMLLGSLIKYENVSLPIRLVFAMVFAKPVIHSTNIKNVKNGEMLLRQGEVTRHLFFTRDVGGVLKAIEPNSFTNPVIDIDNSFEMYIKQGKQDILFDDYMTELVFSILTFIQRSNDTPENFVKLKYYLSYLSKRGVLGKITIDNKLSPFKIMDYLTLRHPKLKDVFEILIDYDELKPSIIKRNEFDLSIVDYLILRAGSDVNQELLKLLLDNGFKPTKFSLSLASKFESKEITKMLEQVKTTN